MAFAQPKNIRFEMRRHIASSHFPIGTRPTVEGILVRAVRYVLVIRQGRGMLNKQPKNQGSLVKALARVRQDEALLRAYVFSALFRAWMIGVNEYPKVNNKGCAATPFVIFAEYVLQRLAI